MSGRIIFSYSLSNAWCLPLCDVSVSENGEVEYQDGTDKVETIFISGNEIEKIKEIIAAHPRIFEYKEVEFPSVLDGVMNFFEFSTVEGKENHILAK